MQQDTGIRLIVGLGNPGDEYQATRHNAGFWLVDRLVADRGGAWRREAKFHGLCCTLRQEGREVLLLKPQTFMNRSGQAVAALASYYKSPPTAILVAHDELDLPLGSLRLKQGGGHAGHNGLRDMIQQLGSRDFWRLRIGIDHPGDKHQVVGYVLGRASQAESQAIAAGIDRVLEQMPLILHGKIQTAMKALHGP